MKLLYCRELLVYPCAHVLCVAPFRSLCKVHSSCFSRRAGEQVAELLVGVAAPVLYWEQGHEWLFGDPVRFQAGVCASAVLALASGLEKCTSLVAVTLAALFAERDAIATQHCMLGHSSEYMQSLTVSTTLSCLMLDSVLCRWHITMQSRTSSSTWCCICRSPWLLSLRPCRPSCCR